MGPRSNILSKKKKSRDTIPLKGVLKDSKSDANGALFLNFLEQKGITYILIETSIFKKYNYFWSTVV